MAPTIESQQKSVNKISNQNIILLKLPEIAGWQIDYPPAAQNLECIAELPALQRGSVWKVKQIESLWDSILQGFPLGAFLLSPVDSSLGKQEFKHQTFSAHSTHSHSSFQAVNTTHMLLDGQQRASGIALGFLNPWGKPQNSHDAKSLLWLDLIQPPIGHDVEFIFRIITKSHPWGYSLINPENRITQNQIRQSLHAFRLANTPQYEQARPNSIPLDIVWPWDAVAPVPVSLLVQALYEKRGSVLDSKAYAWKKIQQLAFMRQLPKTQIDHSSDGIKHWIDQQESVRKVFAESNTRLDEVLELLWQRLTCFVIPANVVPSIALKKTNNTTNKDTEFRSSVETLFIRVNSAGTPLGGEELMYSLIKSAWIGAPDAIAKLTHKLATPARTALFASRLVRARHQRKQWKSSPSADKITKLHIITTPSVEDFRRLMHGQNKEHPTFSKDLQAFISNEGLQVFETAYRFLTEKSFGLPPVLASELAQKSPDVLFLFLCWLDRSIFDDDGSIQMLEIREPDARRILGFLTALGWFASGDSKPRAVDAIWHVLQTVEIIKLPVFFNRERFQQTMEIDSNGKHHMIPLLDPDVLERALQKRILGHQGCINTISKADSPIWKEWKWWEWLIDEKRPKDISDALEILFRNKNTIDEHSTSERIRDFWNQFMNQLWGNSSMLLYVQRDWINRWFPDFDPSQPEFLEDKNRPWDYDHIHPQSHLQGNKGGMLHNLPSIIKDWHNSIGNLRAWPLEANRSDGDLTPKQKMITTSLEENNYEITDANKLAASFISPDDFNNYWSKCESINKKELNDDEAFTYRQALVNAIIYRFINIYRVWFDQLKISTLSNKS